MYVDIGPDANLRRGRRPLGPPFGRAIYVWDCHGAGYGLPAPSWSRASDPLSWNVDLLGAKCHGVSRVPRSSTQKLNANDLHRRPYDTCSLRFEAPSQQPMGCVLSAYQPALVARSAFASSCKPAPLA